MVKLESSFKGVAAFVVSCVVSLLLFIVVDCVFVDCVFVAVFVDAMVAVVFVAVAAAAAIKCL